MGRSLLLFIKSIFCSHDMRHHRNLHGDEINGWDGNRSLWICSKCECLEARPELFTRVMPVGETPRVPMWIDDPHDIESGCILNPEWEKLNPAIAAHMRGDYSKTLIVDRRIHPNPHAALVSHSIVWESWEHRGEYAFDTIFYGCEAIPSTLPHGIRVP